MKFEGTVKENVLPKPPLSLWWICGSVLLTLLLLVGVAMIDYNLPKPLMRTTASKDQFIGEIAHEHLVNLTSVGPRVAGSYENEVRTVAILVDAIKRIAQDASPHNRVELDLQTSSGGFPLTFFDGMNNVYRDVQSVVARVSAIGAKPSHSRSALLLNCHFDTVPDSPGASDDGAGCAVLLETMRALAANPRPLRHDVVFLLNGAEENIMQASHGFITQHKWAKSVRAFINIEACGAGGREVMFQAGPHDPWIVEVYAGVVPHPFTSSFAQELFESGLVPGDTDFRIFRDFGKLSGVDLAWSANGYVYHTSLDTADRVSPAVMQRTGENVLAFAHGLLSSESIVSEVEPTRSPVFFDVLGLFVVCARAPFAASLAILTLILCVTRVKLNARQARKQLYISHKEWYYTVLQWWLRGLAAFLVGVIVALAIATVMHSGGAALSFYRNEWLLAPLYALPAVSASWAILYSGQSTALISRGWWAARACADALCCSAAFWLALCTVLYIRSGFLFYLWVLTPALVDTIASCLNVSDSLRASLWCLGYVLPVLQTWYLALGTIKMAIPMMGRTGPLPADLAMAALVSIFVLTSSSWIWPFVVASREPKRLIKIFAVITLVTMTLVLTTSLRHPYSEERPQRFMMFHTQRTIYARDPTGSRTVQNSYWIPMLDVNTPHSVNLYVPEMRNATEVDIIKDCDTLLYCGAPYYLPVKSLLPRSFWVPAKASPLSKLFVNSAAAQKLEENVQLLQLNIQGPSHIVLIVSPIEGARLTWTNVVNKPLEGPKWKNRRTYFISLHDARRPSPWTLQLHIEHSFKSAPERWADFSIAGHSFFGDNKLHPEHRQLAESFPPWVAVTGWGIDLHLFTL